MATLLMIESWLRSTGLCLPPLIASMGHEYILFTRDATAYGPVDDTGAPHPVLRHAGEVVTVETNDPAETCRVAGEIAARTRIDGVLTTCDYYLETVAVVARSLELPGAPPEVMRRATRKHLVRNALDRAGLPNPAYAVANDWSGAVQAARSIGTPLVAKPVDLNAGTAVELVDSDAALKDAFWHVAGLERNTRGQPLQRLLLLEEQLCGQEVSVEAVTFDGQTSVLGVTDKSVTAAPACVESGHMFPARLEPAVTAKVSAYVSDALDAIGYTHGLSHVEVMLTDDGPRVVEINPRQGGGYIFDLVHLVTGVHPLEMLIELALGEMPRLTSDVTRRTGASGGSVGIGADAGRGHAGDARMATRVASAAVFFVMSGRDGEIDRLSGLDAVDADPHVYRWSTRADGQVRRPRDNDAYLGHVLAVDHDGPRAREYVERAVGAVRLHYADGEVAAPLGVPSGLA